MPFTVMLSVVVSLSVVILTAETAKYDKMLKNIARVKRVSLRCRTNGDRDDNFVTLGPDIIYSYGSSDGVQLNQGPML
jgi:hypothetical protein